MPPLQKQKTDGRDVEAYITAKGRVKDQILIDKLLPHIATALKLRERPSPRARLRSIVQYILRDAAPREEVDRDGVVGPVHGVHTAADGVESGSVRLRIGRGDAAALVEVLAEGEDVAVGRLDGAVEAAVVGDAALGGRVEDHEVAALVVDAFYDVDFAAVD